MIVANNRSHVLDRGQAHYFGVLTSSQIRARW
jgi:hypothetical protein